MDDGTASITIRTAAIIFGAGFIRWFSKKIEHWIAKIAAAEQRKKSQLAMLTDQTNEKANSPPQITYDNRESSQQG